MWQNRNTTNRFQWHFYLALNISLSFSLTYSLSLSLPLKSISRSSPWSLKTHIHLYYRRLFSSWRFTSLVITGCEMKPSGLFFFSRGPRMCQLWCHIHSIVETGWKWALPMQCLRSLLQNERPKSTSDQTKAQTGKQSKVSFVAPGDVRVCHDCFFLVTCFLSKTMLWLLSD